MQALPNEFRSPGDRPKHVGLHKSHKCTSITVVPLACFISWSLLIDFVWGGKEFLVLVKQSLETTPKFYRQGNRSPAGEGDMPKFTLWANSRAPDLLLEVPCTSQPCYWLLCNHPPAQCPPEDRSSEFCFPELFSPEVEAGLNSFSCTQSACCVPSSPTLIVDSAECLGQGGL